jgi:hypothetical protein
VSRQARLSLVVLRLRIRIAVAGRVISHQFDSGVLTGWSSPTATDVDYWVSEFTSLLFVAIAGWMGARPVSLTTAVAGSVHPDLMTVVTEGSSALRARIGSSKSGIHASIARRR